MAYHRGIFGRSIERDFWGLSGMESCSVLVDTADHRYCVEK
jgi:hypothetical protein